MMQNIHRSSHNRFYPALIPRALSRLVFVLLAVCVSHFTLAAADRTTCFLPLAVQSEGSSGTAGVFADESFGDGAGDGWTAYMRIWRAHHADPSHVAVRRFLGLPLTGEIDAKSRRGRAAPTWLGWRSGTYQQVDTPHFTILTHAPPEAAERVAEDLERCYWIWTQMFFPLWEASPQVTTTLSGLTPDTSVTDYLERRPARITIRRKLRIVLFKNASEYQQTLGRDIPGIERSTGFYNDEKKTTFLYVAEVDDAATRRHEMVHQLFREATRSSLGQRLPAEQTGFWLIEGIAGYFESLHIGNRLATVGGWDASRLQFARYRMLVGGDMMPMDQLQVDGRVAAQQRDDLARFYAHAIAQTHRLMDGDEAAERRWIYHQLAERYLIPCDLPAGDLGKDPERRLIRFLTIDDAHLRENPARGDLHRLCLAGCQVTASGLQAIPPSPSLLWLDLSRLRTVDNAALQRLAPSPSTMQQLTLEATGVDADLKDWLGKATELRELDLSWTPMNDSVIESLAGATKIQTLWMTGTRVTDKSIDRIARFRQLEMVDLQRTDVTEAGLQRLRKQRPDLNINPLELRVQ